MLAERGSALVGFAEVLGAVAEAPAGGVSGSELVRLYVQPSAQGLGVGALLLREAESLATGALWLTAWDGNAKALAFYGRMGYADIGATTYTFEGQTYGNRVLVKHLP